MKTKTLKLSGNMISVPFTAPDFSPEGVACVPAKKSRWFTVTYQTADGCKFSCPAWGDDAGHAADSFKEADIENEREIISVTPRAPSPAESVPLDGQLRVEPLECPTWAAKAHVFRGNDPLPIAMFRTLEDAHLCAAHLAKIQRLEDALKSLLDLPLLKTVEGMRGAHFASVVSAVSAANAALE